MLRLSENFREPGLQVQEDCFDMFAGAECINPKIGACAREHPPCARAQLDAIGHPAWRDDFKSRKNPVRRLKVSDSRLLSRELAAVAG